MQIFSHPNIIFEHQLLYLRALDRYQTYAHLAFLSWGMQSDVRY